MIRPLTADDVVMFRELRLRALACDPDAFGGTLAEESLRSDEGWRGMLDARAPVGAVLAHVEDGRALGMCGARIADTPGSGFIWGMFVEPGRRGSGMARDLLAAAEAFLARHGARRVTARVADGNGRALAFYRRCGYAVGAPSGSLRPGSPILLHPIEKPLIAGQA